MKQFLVILIVSLFVSAILADIIYVGPNETNTTIQAGVNAAQNGDTVIVRDGVYSGNDIDISSIDVISENGPDNCIIDGNGNYSCFEMHDDSRICGFTIQDFSYAAIYLDQPHPMIEIENCIFEFNYNAIYSWSPISKLNKCIFRNNTGMYTVMIYADYTLGQNPLVYENIENNLFYDNSTNIDLDLMNASQNYHGLIENNTLIGCNTSFQLNGGDLDIRDCIFYDTLLNSNLTIEYCAFNGEGDYGASNLYNIDPLFSDLEDYEHRLLEGSPCIDAADPNDLDIDGTREDMGCYPTTTDLKKGEMNHWNWISYPRLPDNYGTLASSILDDLIPLTQLEMLHHDDYPFVYNGYDWYPTIYEIESWKGYKLELDDQGSPYANLHLPLPGNRLDSHTSITLLAGEDNWIGYWLPQTQDIDRAFGNNWDKVKSIKAEDWCYLDMSNPRDGEPKPSMKIRPLHYGKGYIVRVTEQFDLVWNESDRGAADRDDAPVPQYFIYDDKPDYEVIDVMDIDENIQEIGVFENGICIGAVVVDEQSEQILVYSDRMDRSDDEIVFEVYYDRGRSAKISDYLVYDERYDKYVPNVIIGGDQEYSTVKFSSVSEPDEEIGNHLLLNYPNPFKPNSIIKYNIPADGIIKLDVYNLKGQLVKSLFCGKQAMGEYSVSWHGKDDNNEPVASGIYFYRLEAGENIANKRVVFMR